MDKNKIGVHRAHCCIMHGCKYGDEDCPVVNKKVKQDYTCEDCTHDGIKSLEELDNWDNLTAYAEIENNFSSSIKNLTLCKNGQKISLKQEEWDKIHEMIRGKHGIAAIEKKNKYEASGLVLWYPKVKKKTLDNY